MTWRLRKDTAGSGALGDIASHAIDQVLFLLADQVTDVSGRLQTFTSHRPGARGLEEVTVDDAAWATLTRLPRLAPSPRLKSHAWPPGRKTRSNSKCTATKAPSCSTLKT